MSIRIVDGEPVTQEDLDRAHAILHAYADDIEKNEPYARVSIDHLREAALHLPDTPTAWSEEYPSCGVMCGGTAEDADFENREALEAERARYQLPREHCDLPAREAERVRQMSREELFRNVGPGG